MSEHPTNNPMTATRGHEAGARDRAWAIVHDPYDMDRPGVPLVTVPRDALVDRIAAALQASVQDVERLNVCDACGGSGRPISGLPCMCRGTGRMDEAARYLREQLVDVERRLGDAEREIKTDNELLAERNRILDAYPCPAHGPCVPHVMDLLARAQALAAALEKLEWLESDVGGYACPVCHSWNPEPSGNHIAGCWFPTLPPPQAAP